MTGFSLRDRRILVTGAASGIGAAVARICARLGAEIILADIADAEPVAREIRAGDGAARSLPLDSADREAVERLCATLGRIDALVASAAVCPWNDDWRDPGWEAQFERVMAVNVLGPLHCIRALLPGMVARRDGRIVLIGSLAGRMGGLIAGPHYVASKGALHALVKWLARQAAPHNVLVNAVAPASIATPMMQERPVDLGRIPLGRMGTAEEIAWPVAFLCAPAASYVTGTVLDVNGGVFMA
ncbi:MAG TPA: SDR family NAD(P)-dependent oxidoreductase [Acetobacteraceae bacterium]|nr:SDR family NAD(P)-dependent oxidoreductase [Acetobacteraceae bacterium]